MTKPSYKLREKGRREREILLSARRLIHENGYAALNMDDLADAVGISKPTLYQHFKSKEELLIHVLSGAMREIEAFVCATGEEAPLERLKIVLRAILRSRYDADGLLSDFDNELIRSALFAQPDILAIKQRIMAQVTRMIDEGKARGEITPTISTLTIGCLFFRLIGLPATVQAVLLPEALALSDPDTLPQLIDEVVELFARSIAQHEADA